MFFRLPLTAFNVSHSCIRLRIAAGGGHPPPAVVGGGIVIIEMVRKIALSPAPAGMQVLG